MHSALDSEQVLQERRKIDQKIFKKNSVFNKSGKFDTKGFVK
jgi:hypothetical protein